VYFSSCDTLAENGNRLRRFVRRTESLAVCGFRRYVDWLTSTAFDLLFLREAQSNAFTVAGMRAISSRVKGGRRSLQKARIPHGRQQSLIGGRNRVIGVAGLGQIVTHRGFSLR